MTTTRDRLHDLGLYAPQDPPVEDLGPCRVCGCVDDDACYDDVAGKACHWTERDLCSMCARGLHA